MLLEFHSRVKIKKLNKINDNRGWLMECLRKDEDKFNPAMIYTSFTKAGEIRGPHEHKKQTDYFIFAGPGNAEFFIWEKQFEYVQNNSFLVGEDNPVAIIVPPGVVHGYKAITDTYIINLPDKLYKGFHKKKEVDEIRWENKINSPYEIK